MKCPFCSSLENRVIDSRLAQNGDVTRRRRECEACARRYTTYERLEQTVPTVVKKSGSREQFDRSKLLSGLKRACEKRPVSAEDLDLLVSQIEKKLSESGEPEVASTTIGQEVMERLRDLDQVAYVRFASVYRSFQDVNEFMSELKNLVIKS